MLSYETNNNSFIGSYHRETKPEEQIDFSRYEKILSSFESYSEKLEKLIETTTVKHKDYKL